MILITRQMRADIKKKIVPEVKTLSTSSCFYFNDILFTTDKVFFSDLTKDVYDTGKLIRMISLKVMPEDAMIEVATFNLLKSTMKPCAIARISNINRHYRHGLLIYRHCLKNDLNNKENRYHS